MLFNYHQRLEWQSSSEFQEHELETVVKNDTQIDINVQDKVWVDELTKWVKANLKFPSAYW